MFNYQETLQAMRSQRASMQQELDRLDRAIAALQAVVNSPAPAKSAPKSSVQSGRDVSRRGSRPVKAKPAKSSIQEKAQQPKRKISAQGLRNIIEAQKKRWANVRSAKANVKQSVQTKAKSAATSKASRPVGQ